MIDLLHVILYILFVVSNPREEVVDGFFPGVFRPARSDDACERAVPQTF